MRRIGRRCPQCGSRWCLVWLLIGDDPSHAPAPPPPRSLAAELGATGGVEFFGPRWDAPVLEGARPVEVPVGRVCLSCQEPIRRTDRGVMRTVMRLPADGDWAATNEPVHAECDLRSAVGHTVGVCPCHGYDNSHASAVIAWQRFRGDMR